MTKHDFATCDIQGARLLSRISEKLSQRETFAEYATWLSAMNNEQQDAIVTRLIAELKDEQSWQARFEVTSDEQWDNLAALVRKDIATGDINLLD